VHCESCNYTSLKSEAFLDLSLEIPPTNTVSSHALESLLHDFCRPEVLGAIPTPPSSIVDSICTAADANITTKTTITITAPAKTATPPPSSSTDHDNFHSCNKCHRWGTSSKSLRISELPEILSFHLKRFHWVGNDFLIPGANTGTTRKRRRQTQGDFKNDVDVTFPLQGLDMSKYLLSRHDYGDRDDGDIDEANMYDLYALVSHHGKEYD